MSRQNISDSNQHTPVIIGTPDDHVRKEPLLTSIRRVAEGNNTITFVGSAAGNNDKKDITLTWGELHRDALAMAAVLQEKGIKPGDHVALLGPTTRSLVTAIQAVWFAGGRSVLRSRALAAARA